MNVKVVVCKGRRTTILVYHTGGSTPVVCGEQAWLFCCQPNNMKQEQEMLIGGKGQQ